MRVGILRIAALSLVVLAFVAGCRPVRNAVTAIPQEKEANLWRLSNGKILLLIDGNTGNIVHYGLRNDSRGLRVNQNVLWSNTKTEGTLSWTSSGGEKAKLWPEQPVIPQPSGPWAIAAEKDSIVLTSGVIPGYGVRIIRKIEINELTTSVVITTRLDRVENSFGNPLGLASITQIATPELCYVRVPLVSDRTRLVNARDGFSKKAVGNVVELKSGTSQQAKAKAEAEVMAAVYSDVVFLQRQIPVHEDGLWAQDERAQIASYGPNPADPMRATSSVDLTWTSPALPPNRVENTGLKVVWKLVERKKETTPEQIAEMVQALP